MNKQNYKLLLINKIIVHLTCANFVYIDYIINKPIIYFPKIPKVFIHPEIYKGFLIINIMSFYDGFWNWKVLVIKNENI